MFNVGGKKVELEIVVKNGTILICLKRSLFLYNIVVDKKYIFLKC